MMKQILRNKLKAVRQGIPDIQRTHAQQLINEYILNFIADSKAKVVAGYYPINSEVDIIAALKKCKIEVALPSIKSDILEFKKWIFEEGLVNNGKFLEPNTAAETITPEIILLPTLGFDESGARIGYGLGYYDKTLIRFPNAIFVIVAFSIQKLLEIPTENHDIRAHIIITEDGIQKCNHTKNLKNV